MEWLKKIRQEKAVTQEFVAHRTGIARTHYTHIENGNRCPSVEVAKRIAAVLDFNWTRFFEDEKEAANDKTL